MKDDYLNLSAEEFTERSINDIEQAWADGKIQNPENLANDAAYIWSGQFDQVVPPTMQIATEGVYNHYGTNNILVSEAYEHWVPDGKLTEALKWLYNALEYNDDDFEPPVSNYLDYGTQENFMQAEFLDSGWDFDDTDFHDYGAYYIPTDCETMTCKVHFVFHGCYGSGEWFLNDNEDLMQFAATNKIALIFPSSYCWDWEGDFDPNTSRTTDGLYVRAIMAMIDRITSDEITYTATAVPLEE